MITQHPGTGSQRRNRKGAPTVSNPYAPPDPSSRPERSQARPDDDAGHHGEDTTGRGAGPGDHKPRRPQPTPEQLAATSRSVLHFGLLMLVAVLTMQLDLPWQLVSIVFAAAAVVVGVRTMVRILRQGQRGGLAALLIFGLVLSGMLVVSTTTSLALWNEQMDRQECLNSAITVTAQERCERAYEEAIEDRFELIPSDF